MLKLYDYLPSQNAYKVRLLLNHLGIEYETVEVPIFTPGGRDAAFMAKNPMGAVPVLELEDGRTLPESNAILLYLAEGTPYLPADAWGRAQVSRWMFFEEDCIQTEIATLRYWTLTGKLARRPAGLVEAKRTRSLRTLAKLDSWLASHEFLVETGYSIADMAVFAYTAFSEEAGLPLQNYPHLVVWIERVKAQPGFLATVYPYSIDPDSSNELR